MRGHPSPHSLNPYGRIITCAGARVSINCIASITRIIPTCESIYKQMRLCSMIGSSPMCGSTTVGSKLMNEGSSRMCGEHKKLQWKGETEDHPTYVPGSTPSSMCEAFLYCGIVSHIAGSTYWPVYRPIRRDHPHVRGAHPCALPISASVDHPACAGHAGGSELSIILRIIPHVRGAPFCGGLRVALYRIIPHVRGHSSERSYCN